MLFGAKAQVRIHFVWGNCTCGSVVRSEDFERWLIFYGALTTLYALTLYAPTPGGACNRARFRAA
jgi:hypothetical protein